jgi:Na+/pantothenate symporter
MDAIESLRATEEGATLLSWRGGVALPVLLGTLFAATAKMAVEPRQLSRFYALGDSRALKQGMWISVLLFAGVYACLVPLGLFAHGILGPGVTDTDLVVPQLLIAPDVFSTGTAAFLMVAMVAAAMSSVDSVLLVMASTCERDIVSVIRPGQTDAGALRHTRWYVALFAGITALIALTEPAGIVTLTALSGALYAACFFPAMLLGLFWPRGNGLAVIGSFVAGLLVLLLWEYVPGSEVVHEVFPAVILSFGAYAAFAYLMPSAEVETVERLFREIQVEKAAKASVSKA